MVLPLPRLPAGTTALRLNSNIEIYWDRLRVVREEPLQATARTLTPNIARVARPGFPKRSTGAQRLPHYDYHDRAPYDDAKVPRGFYTAWGDALPLVADVDGALAIIGSGEEVHLEFPAVAATAGECDALLRGALSRLGQGHGSVHQGWRHRRAAAHAARSRRRGAGAAGRPARPPQRALARRAVIGSAPLSPLVDGQARRPCSAKSGRERLAVGIPAESPKPQR